jgi:uncharacterized membrane protein (DUF106 family)
MANKKITFTKKECEHIAEWLDKDLMTELEKVMSSLSTYYKEAKSQKDKAEIKKLVKYNSKQALQINNMTKSIINKIEREYQ